MKIPFTKMQGAGNDFVVLDETRSLFNLTPADYRRLGDRHLGVGADQILSVRAASSSDVDFDYVIHNNDGSEVAHCGNGARCFVRFVREQGLTNQTTIKVRTKSRVLTLTETADEHVTVDMGTPIFAATQIPYLTPSAATQVDWNYVLSVGNPHAVCVVPDVQTAPVALRGPAIQNNPAFPEGVNVGFMQVVSPSHIKLRVYERGAGETLACGTGACAAVVAGIQMGLLDSAVRVSVLGGELTIRWDLGTAGASIWMTGPAVTVYQGTIEL